MAPAAAARHRASDRLSTWLVTPELHRLHFGSPNQWASMRYLAPEWFERIAAFEVSFGRTIQRACGIRSLADRGRPYLALIQQPDLARRALEHAWDEPVRVRPSAWAMPAGAFGDSAGPI